MGVSESSQRQVAYITPEDEAMEKRRPLWAFGPYHVAKLAGRTTQTVYKTMANKGIPLNEIVEAVAWALAKQGAPDLADQVLERLGYEPRYVRRR